MKRGGVLIMVLGVIAILSLTGTAALGGCRAWTRGTMLGFTGQMMWPFMGWGMFFWALILAGLGCLVWLSLRPRGQSYREQDALEKARIRLANGEITPEEFDEIKSKLKQS